MWYNVTGLNSAVEVVGNMSSDSGGFTFLLDSNGTFDNLGILPGYAGTTATGISANGQVIGYSGLDNAGVDSGLPLVQAFLDVNGVMTPLGTLDGGATPAESEPFGVNDSGQVVGWSYVMNATRNAFLYSGGQMTDLGTLGGGSLSRGSSMAKGINDSGQIVGSTTVVNGIR